jgi:hypothetical protein
MEDDAMSHVSFQPSAVSRQLRAFGRLAACAVTLLAFVPGCFIQLNEGATPTSTENPDLIPPDSGQTTPATPGQTPSDNLVAGDTTVVAAPAEAPPPTATVPPGTLTAGSIDDNLNFDDFRTFVSKVLQEDYAGELPNVPLGQRIIVGVRDEWGVPVGDARVVVEIPGESPVTVLDRHTGSDGRLLFLTELDDGTGTTTYALTIYPPDGSTPIVETRMAQNLEWNVTLAAGVGALPGQLDLAIVLDTTRSMAEELEYLRTEIREIVGTIAGLYPSVLQRYALVAYRDQGDVYVARSYDFTTSLDTFIAQLDTQVADGGGDVPEALHQALERAAALSWQPAGSGTARVVFVIADAPPHREHAQRTYDALQALRNRAVRIFPIAASVAHSDLEFFLRIGSFLTLGEYSFMTDDGGIGSSYARPDLPCYYVQQIDQLMTRLVQGALAGTRVEPDAANIIRTVGNPEDGVCAGPAPAAEQ